MKELLWRVVEPLPSGRVGRRHRTGRAMLASHRLWRRRRLILESQSSDEAIEVHPSAQAFMRVRTLPLMLPAKFTAIRTTN